MPMNQKLLDVGSINMDIFTYEIVGYGESNLEEKNFLRYTSCKEVNRFKNWRGNYFVRSIWKSEMQGVKDV
jgi:hypothetical protein